MSDKEFEKLLKDAQDKAFKDASKGLTAQDRTQRKNTKAKLKKRNPPFAALRKEVTDAYEGKTKFPSKFKDKKGMREYVKGEGHMKGQSVKHKRRVNEKWNSLHKLAESNLYNLGANQNKFNKLNQI